MLQFIFGVFIGGIMGFIICAVLSINNTESGESPTNPENGDLGDSNAPNQ